MKVYELKKSKNLSHAIHAIALVEKPAIETDFIYLSVDGQKALSNLYLAEEKGIIYSPVLIPEQRIKRVNPNTNEVYEIFFSAETIEESAYDMMKAKEPLSEFNKEHSNEKIDRTNIVELWIVEDPEKDKATALGFDVPKGTLMTGIKVENEETKEAIKLGKIKGISIEGLFQDFDLVEENGKQVNLNKSEMTELTEEAKKQTSLLTKLAAFLEPKVKLASVQIDEETTLYTEGDFVEGAMVYTDEAMSVPASGSYEVDGRRLVISEGALTAIESVESEELKKKEEEMNEVTLKAAEAVVKLTEDLEALQAENESLKVQLKAVEEKAEKHEVLLSKVEEAENEKAKVNLSTQVNKDSKFAQLRAKANNR